MGNAKIWEGTLTYTENGQTVREHVKLISDSDMDVTDQTNVYKNFWYYTGQTYQYACSSEIHFTTGQTVTEEAFTRVDYNKNLGKYIAVEDDEHDYAIIGTNLTCADLEETGNTYTLIYHDSQEGVLKGDLTLKYIEGDTIYWGNNDIDICLHVCCYDGAIITDYSC